MRACVYVDGFNLYYGMLRDRPVRWLNLLSLAQALLPEKEIVLVRYFTARVNGDNDPSRPQRQDIYIRALRHFSPRIVVHEGKFLRNTTRYPLAESPERTVAVLRTEEKGTDVALATNLIVDAATNRFDTALLITNDSDFSPAIEAVRDTLLKQVGIAFPVTGERRPSKNLASKASFTRQIREDTLIHHQLPEEMVLPSGKKLFRPKGW